MRKKLKSFNKMPRSAKNFNSNFFLQIKVWIVPNFYKVSRVNVTATTTIMKASDE